MQQTSYNNPATVKCFMIAVLGKGEVILKICGVVKQVEVNNLVHWRIFQIKLNLTCVKLIINKTLFHNYFLTK